MNKILFTAFLAAITLLMLIRCEQKPIEFQETLTFKSTDTLTITADIYRTGNKGAPMILMFHQSASSRGEYATIAPDLQKRGFNCMAVDLRWGKQDFWNKVPNRTGERYGSWPVIDNYERTDEYQYNEVWPRMFASYKDIVASINYVKKQGYSGPIIIWGSSFSAMLVFRAAAELPDLVNGVVAYSPGEYFERDTLMLTKWINQVKQPVFMNAGSDSSELLMVDPLFSFLPSHSNHKLHQSVAGRHGSSVLINDDRNWQPVLKYLQQFETQNNKNYLQYSEETAKWIENTRTKNPDNIWPDRLGEPESVTAGMSQGVASKVLLFLELFEATDDSTYLNAAKVGVDYQLANLPQTADTSVNWRFGLYHDICGAGTSLLRYYEATGDDNAKYGVLNIVDFLTENAIDYGDSVAWGPGNDLLGGLAGTGLFLLEVGNKLDLPESKTLAEKVGQTLLARAIREGTGLNWYFGQDRPFVLPNFSHGTAGISFFLARLGEASGNEMFTQAAKSGYEYLLSIASDTLGGGFLLPYGVPNDWPSGFEMGWAHGPAGTARFFQEQYRITGNQEWLDEMKSCYETGVLAGYPDSINPIFGSYIDPINSRFGMAGLAHLAIDLYLLTGEKSYLDFGKKVVDHIITYSRVTDEGMYWPVTTRNGGVDTFTGHFYGASGYGRLFLKLHLAENNQKLKYLQVDEVPFQQQAI